MPEVTQPRSDDHSEASPHDRAVQQVWPLKVGITPLTSWPV
jgi:hypothetical protein